MITNFIFFTTVDRKPPKITKIDDITETVSPGSPGKTVTWKEPRASDDSGPAELVSRTKSPNDFFTVETTPVTYIYADLSGNTASMTFNVHLIENSGKLIFAGLDVF